MEMEFGFSLQESLGIKLIDLAHWGSSNRAGDETDARSTALGLGGGKSSVSANEMPIPTFHIMLVA